MSARRTFHQYLRYPIRICRNRPVSAGLAILTFGFVSYWSLKEKSTSTTSVIQRRSDAIEQNQDVLHPAVSTSVSGYSKTTLSSIMFKDPSATMWQVKTENVAAVASIGPRPSMEDRFTIMQQPSGHGLELYGVFDGHGGMAHASALESGLLDIIVSKFEKNPTVFQNVDTITKFIDNEIVAYDEFLSRRINATSGSTALIAIRHNSRDSNSNKLIVANVGDSRGVMCNAQGTAVPVSFDHKPDLPKEHDRIKRAGGYIANFGVWRVMGILAMSRAIGDQFLKTPKQFVIANPDVLVFDSAKLEGAKFVILASDGLWDVVSNEEAIRHVLEKLNDSDVNQDISYFGADSLLDLALSRQSTDNVAIMIVKL